MSPGAAARAGGGDRPALRDLFGIDLRSLAAFRIGLGGLIGVDLLLRARFVAESYSDQGWMPRELIGNRTLFALHHWSGEPAHQWLLFGLAALFAAMLLLGYRTRLASIASWVLLVSLQERNAYLGYGGDYLLRMLLLWGMLLPLGARWSLDARRRPDPDAGGSCLSVASAALLVQFVLLYLSAGLGKVGTEWRSEGSAVELVLRQEYFGGPLRELLLSAPGLLRWITPAVVGWEIVAPLLMFVPFQTARVRVVLVIGFWLFQLGLGLGIALHLFPLVSSCAALPFLPGAFWDRLCGRDPPPVLGAAGRGAVRGPLRWVVELVAALLLLDAVASVLHNFGVIRTPDVLRRVETALGLHQRWRVYSPGPPRFDPAFSVKGLLANGSIVEVLPGPDDDAWSPLRRLQRSFRFRAHLYRSVLQEEQRDRRLERYLEWLCLRWNAAPPTGSGLQETLFFSAPLYFDEPEGRRHSILLARHRCAGGGTEGRR